MDGTNDLQDDEYIAKLLAEDARKVSLKYSSIGLSALLPRRPVNSAPKPNTRFLKNLVREADNHNAALKEREQQEAQSRLRRFRDGRTELKPNEDSRRRERVRNGREERHKEDNHRRGRRKRSTSSERRINSDTDISRSKRRRRNHDIETTDDERHQRKRAGPKTRHKSDLSMNYLDRKGKDIEFRKASYSSVHQKRSISADSKIDSGKRHSKGRAPRTILSQNNSREKQMEGNSEDSDQSSYARDRSTSSDPLESLVGPLPLHDSKLSRNSKRRSSAGADTVQQRGRGAYKSNPSSIDAHFSSKYDPALDVHPELESLEERDDWDMALEALRDRQQWQRKHADRLRDAGFGDDEIEKWLESGKEKTANDVRWRKKGEAREWDLGKPEPGDKHQSSKKKEASKELADVWARKNSGFQKGLRNALR